MQIVKLEGEQSVMYHTERFAEAEVKDTNMRFLLSLSFLANRVRGLRIDVSHRRCVVLLNRLIQGVRNKTIAEQRRSGCM